MSEPNGWEAEADSYARKPVFFQVSTLNALMVGNFDGAVTVGCLKRHGSWGIGTYEGLDGEAIICDGHAYHAHYDGTATEYANGNRLAFATVADLTDRATAIRLQGISKLAAIKHALDRARRAYDDNDNAWCLVSLRGSFTDILVRSCRKCETKPYPTFPELASNQYEHAYARDTGWLIGVWTPTYLEGINMPGWHLHYLSDDRSRGGHVLNLSVDQATGRLETYCRFEMALPTNREFDKLDLTEDLSQQTRAVEG